MGTPVAAEILSRLAARKVTPPNDSSSAAVIKLNVFIASTIPPRYGFGSAMTGGPLVEKFKADVAGAGKSGVIRLGLELRRDKPILNTTPRQSIQIDVPAGENDSDTFSAGAGLIFHNRGIWHCC
jgi:hypothetical protein